MTTRVYQSAVTVLAQPAPPDSTPRVYQSFVNVLAAFFEANLVLEISPGVRVPKPNMPLPPVLY